MSERTALVRRVRLIVAVVVALATSAAMLGSPDARAAKTPRTTLIGVRAPGVFDPYDMRSLEAWQGKPNAVAVTFRKDDVPAAEIVAKLALIWSEGSVPMLTIEPRTSNVEIAAGLSDTRIDAWASAIKLWLAGRDRTYGNADDRRLFIRLAHEANGGWYPWSPCSATGGTPADYQAMWRRYHDRFASTGIDRTRLAWVFSMNQTDTSLACKPELLYPGDRYVDWLGLDGYSRSRGKTPAQELAPMARRLRSIAPGTPLSINEWGASAVVTGDKSTWLTEYFRWVRANDIRMLTYFNIDNARDWAVFGGGRGDEVFTFRLRTYNAWSAYRKALEPGWVVGADRANPRLLSDDQFLGR